MARVVVVVWLARRSSRALLLRSAQLAWLVDSLVHHAYPAVGERDVVRSTVAGVSRWLGCRGGWGVEVAGVSK
ncbi:MAG: hypothetical protein M0013_02875 [Actinomycetota bacterium]|nr:hypothetical protein [Actinomycetota bacterium]